MKKQLMKTALLTAAVMGAMTFSSCKENENEVAPDLGKKVEATIGVKLAGRPGASLKKASSADDLNMGTAINDIANIVIVPFTGANAGNNIVYGSFKNGEDENKYVTATIPQSTNMFRIYGNLPGTFTPSAVFALPDLSLKNDGFSAGDAALTDVYPAHPLYYFAEAVGSVDVSTTGFKVGTSTTAGDWNTVATSAPANGQVGENNRVAIVTPLRYAVGALAAGVLDGVAGDNLTKLMFFQGDADEPTEVKSWNDLKATTGAITLEGIVIEGQSIKFDERMKPVGDEVRVYAEADSKSMITGKLANVDGKVAGANIYSVVAPEDAQSITVNFQFKNNTGYSMELNNDDAEATGKQVIADQEYFYMATSIKRDADQNKDIFAAFTSTILNATVTDWGKASKTPVETTEVELGITVDVTWEEGITYDVEL